MNSRQKTELEQSIFEYLKSCGYEKTCKSMLEEASIIENLKMQGNLERKWTSILKMQRRIKELEAQVVIPRKNTDSIGNTVVEFKEHAGAITKLKFHPFQPFLFSASDDCTIKVWNLESGQCKQTLVGHGQTVTGISLNPQGTILVSCSQDCKIKLWDVTQGFVNQKTLLHDDQVSCVEFINSDLFVSASRDCTCKVWNLKGECIQTLFCEGWIRCLSVSGPLIACASTDKIITLWNMDRNYEKSRLFGHDHVIDALVFSDNRLFSGSRDKTIKVWDLETMQNIYSLIDHANWVRDLTFFGSKLVSVSDDKSCRAWDLETKTSTIVDCNEKFLTCCTSCHGMLAIGSADKTIKLYK